MTLTLDDLRARTTVTVEEAAAVLGIGRRLAYEEARRWAETKGAEGCVPALRVGQRLVVPAPRLLALLGDAAADVG